MNKRKPTKVEFTESIGLTPTDMIIRQCRYLIWDKVGEEKPNIFTHTKKACKVCRYRFKCWTVK